MELERVLTKLKFDESVTGYALITNDGQPFLSFSLPDEVLPQVKGTLKIHADDLKLVNIMTSQGSVILSRVDPQWVLAVLFTPDLSLGTALSRARAVVELLEQVSLPPPPVPIETEVDSSALSEDFESTATTSIEELDASHIEDQSALPEVIQVNHGCVVLRGERYRDAMTLESALNTELKKVCSNLGVDVLLMIDEKMTVFKIAGQLAKPLDRVLSVVRWCLDQKIVDVECPDMQEPSRREIVELPLFEGNIDKVKKEHRQILALCDGKRTLQEISTEVGLQYFQVLQAILPYKGKTLRMVGTDKMTGD